MENNYLQPLKMGLQGTRPAPLKISKRSRRISKAPTVQPILQSRKPVIIYVRSPEVIHTQPGEFMALVQRLTGRSPREENTVKMEAAVEGLRPSTWTDHSESIANSLFDGRINNISPFAQGDVQIEMSSAIVNVCGLKFEEGGLIEDLEEFPPNMTSPYAEDRHTSLPGLHSVGIAPPLPNSTTLMMPSDGVQDYSLNMYECSRWFDSLIHSDSSAPQFGWPSISDPLDVFTALPRDCSYVDPEDFSISIPASLDLFNNVYGYNQF